ncbi:MAG: hypothetical protein KAS32_19115 [Candidatus Peribacteraceae bacterium]|nr:hypothetical protein [Candidatus Peribacteraceae bacterium]
MKLLILRYMSNLHRDIAFEKILTMIIIVILFGFSFTDTPNNLRQWFFMAGCLWVCIGGLSVIIDWPAVEAKVEVKNKWMRVVKYFNSRYGETITRTEFLNAMGQKNHSVENTWDKYRRLLARAGYLTIVERGVYQLLYEINNDNASILRDIRRLVDNVSDIDNKLPNFKFL